MLLEARIVVIGEIHGTREGPRAIGTLICNLPKERPVALFIEWPKKLNGEINSWLSGAGSAYDQLRLFSNPYFAETLPDGKTSDAMVALLLRLRELIADGRRIEVRAFDVEASAHTSNATRATDMAESIERQVGEVAPNSQVLVYTGNFHARVNPPLQESAAAVTMATRLAERFPTLRALNMSHEGGTAWACWSRTTCGEMKFIGSEENNTLNGATLSVSVSNSLTQGFHGKINVGKITASPPFRQLSPKQ